MGSYEAARHVTVVCNEAGDCVAVTYTDEEGRILKTIWEKPVKLTPMDRAELVGELREMEKNNRAARRVRTADILNDAAFLIEQDGRKVTTGE